MHRQQSPSDLSVVLQVLLGALVLSGIAILYRRPFIFHDSGTYLLYGQHIADELANLLRGSRSYSIGLGEVQEDYAGARSPAYSVLLFVTAGKINLWSIVALQALTASWLLFVTARCFWGSQFNKIYGVGVLILGFATSLPYYVAFAMPDVFTGLGALALILLLCAFDRLFAWERAIICIILAASASFHVSNALTFTAAAAIGLCTVCASGLSRVLATRTSATLIGVALLMGAAVGPVYRQVERVVFRHPISAPPFLTARVLADGPGLTFLRNRCSIGRAFVLCDYAPEPPVDADAFLWAKEQDGGFFEYKDTQTRRALIAEQNQFVQYVLKSYPLEQASASLRNAAEQLTMIEVEEPLADPRTQSSYPLFQEVHGLPDNPPFEAALRLGRQILVLVTLPALVCFTAWALAKERKGYGVRRALIVTATVASMLLLNAALTGAISGPHPRYQARLMWILPAVLALVGPGLTRNILRSRRRRDGSRFRM